jgi:hypothetical protein
MAVEEALAETLLVDEFMLSGPDNMLTDFMAPTRNRFSLRHDELLKPKQLENIVQPITNAILSGNYLSVRKLCEDAMVNGDCFPGALVGMVNEQLRLAGSTYSLKDLGDDRIAINGWKMSELELNESKNGEPRWICRFQVKWRPIA